MKFDTVIHRLSSALVEPLPGRLGQMMMAPTPVDESRFARSELPSAKKGAVLLLFYPDNERCMLPFIKRTSYDGIHAGQVSFPGGKWERTDASMSYTARRETEEEIGVKMENITILGSLSSLYIPPSNFLVTPFVGYVDETPEFVPHPREVDRVITCSFDHLMDRTTRKLTEVSVQEGYLVSAPYFDIENEVVWGATAMILAELLHVWDPHCN